MNDFCIHNADQLGSLAGLSLLTVYVGVVECVSASPYTYSSSTHMFPDERTPIEATPLSSTSWFRIFLISSYQYTIPNWAHPKRKNIQKVWIIIPKITQQQKRQKLLNDSDHLGLIQDD
jgi:hypothetical protein